MDENCVDGALKLEIGINIRNYRYNSSIYVIWKDFETTNWQQFYLLVHLSLKYFTMKRARVRYKFLREVKL